jgi:prepilin-type N-terminal cleavage/methylation domain-containing protein
MISPIGKSDRSGLKSGPGSRRRSVLTLKTPAGFTFLECMAAIAILSLGVVAIYRAFSLSLDIQNDLYYRLYARNFLETRIDVMRCVLSEGLQPGSLELPTDEQLRLNRRTIDFSFQTQLEPLAARETVAQLTLNAAWAVRGHARQRQYVGYVHQSRKKEE